LKGRSRFSFIPPPTLWLILLYLPLFLLLLFQYWLIFIFFVYICNVDLPQSVCFFPDSLIVTADGSPMMVILLILHDVTNTSRVSSDFIVILVQSGNLHCFAFRIMYALVYSYWIMIKMISVVRPTLLTSMMAVHCQHQMTFYGTPRALIIEPHILIW
jgi:hypothetical protein